MFLKKALKFNFSVWFGVWGAFTATLFFAGIAIAQSQNSLQANPLKTHDRNWKLDWNLKAAGESYEEGLDQQALNKTSKIFESRFGVNFQYGFSESLYLDIQPRIRFQSGRIQSLDGADSPNNSFSIRQAALHTSPVEIVKLSAGALNQRDMHTNLTVDELAFPAARAGLHFSPEVWQTGIVTEASIPSSNSLQTNTNEVEPTPTKTAAHVYLNWTPKSYLKGKNKIGYFKYNNLPSDVATASKLLGNSTELITQEESRFTYNYQGYEASSKWELPLLRRLDLLIDLEGAQNQSAPTGRNTAYSAGGGLRWIYNSKHDFTIDTRRFQIQSDVAPAYFSNRENLRTNRIGYDIGGKWHLKKQNFSVGFLYREAQVLIESPSQSLGRIYQINLETDYDSL